MFAAQAAGEGPWSGALVWTAMLLVAAVLLGAGLLYCRRWYYRRDDGLQQTWTLQQLNELYRTGQLTREEFERLKARLVDELRSSDAR